MSGVHSLSTAVEITFILPKVYLKKLIKKQLNFSNFTFCFMWKTGQLFMIFFHLSFPEVLHKSVLLSIIKARRWEYCFTQTNNHKKFKILRFTYFQTLYLHVFHLIVAASLPNFWILPAFIWGQCSPVFVTFSWFFHRFNKR